MGERFSSYVEKQNIELIRQTSIKSKNVEFPELPNLPSKNKLTRQRTAPAKSYNISSGIPLAAIGKKGTKLTLQPKKERSVTEQWYFHELASRFLSCLEKLPPNVLQKAMNDFIQNCDKE